MKGIIEFKTLKQRNEWLDRRLSIKLQGIVFAMANISYYIFDKPLVITEIYRTQKQQDKYYKNNPVYREKPWPSVHQHWRGIDIRTSNYTQAQIDILLNIANCIQYDPQREERKTAIYHDVNHGLHLHVQSLI